MSVRPPRRMFEVILKLRDGRKRRAEFGPAVNPPGRISLNEDGQITMGRYSHQLWSVDSDTVYLVYNEEEEVTHAGHRRQDSL